MAEKRNIILFGAIILLTIGYWTSSTFFIGEKPFEIKWNIQKKSITTIPINIDKKLKIICKDFNKIILIKIKTFKDNTAIGTFECRI